MVDLEQLGQQAQQASYTLGLLSTAQKNQVLTAMATALTSIKMRYWQLMRRI